MPSYGDFGFISWGNQEKQNKTQIFNSTTRTSDPCRVGRSTFITSSSKQGNGMRNLLGSCVRAFLVAGPARSSRSHGARVACGRRSQKKKTLDCCFGCLEFVLVARLLLLDGHNTRDIGQGCTDALPLRGGRCTGAVAQLRTRVATPVSS